MNPLQEHPYLFANGKFKVEWEFQGEPYDIYEILGWSNEYQAILVEGTSGSQFDFLYTNECTLIARPIEDMSDEEIKTYESHCTIIRPTEWYEDGSSIIQTRDGFLYLLSIGVYPFDQQHFEEGTVINEAEIRNKMG